MNGTTSAPSQVLALKQAIRRAGGVKALAREQGVTHQCVYVWRKKGCVPIDRAVEIERKHGIPAINLVDPQLAACVRQLLTQRQEARRE